VTDRAVYLRCSRCGAVNRLRVVKVNLDDEPYLGARFSINATPTFYLYRKGGKLGDISGAVPKEQLYAWLDSLLLR
jgi:thioredoxin-like negative regulator of GroEL